MLALLSAAALSLAVAGPVLAEEPEGAPVAGSAAVEHQDEAATRLAEADQDPAVEPKDGEQDQADSDGVAKPEAGTAESENQEDDGDGD
jgi:hypothetical protein